MSMRPPNRAGWRCWALFIPLLAGAMFAAESPTPAPCQFGVIVGGKGRVPQLVDILKDLGASCARVNCRLGDRDHDLARFLDAGLDLVVTFNNNDPANLGTTYGTPREWPNAGFPFRSKAAYQQRVRDVLEPLKPFLASGRRVWAQCENECSDAAFNPKSRYWRGTTAQYLAQIQAFREAVKSVDPAIPVVLTSFASESLSAAIEPADRRHLYAAAHLAKLLASPDYDAVDLHFYGGVEDIPAKVDWVKERLPAGKRWISTENGGPDPRCASTPISWRKNPAEFEQLQAKQVAQRLQAAADQGASLCLWFSMFDLRGETSDVFNRLGLLDQSVTPPRKKPAYEAFKKFVTSRASPSADTPSGVTRPWGSAGRSRNAAIPASKPSCCSPRAPAAICSRKRNWVP